MTFSARLCLFSALCLFVGLSMAIDLDGDGFHSDSPVPRFVDCCDTVLECDDPYMVNPGAYDFFGDGVVNDCGQGTTRPKAKTPRDAYCDSQATDFVVDIFTGPNVRYQDTEKLALAMDICEFVDDDDDPTWGYMRQENVVVSLADGSRIGWDPKPSTSGPQSIQIASVRRFGRFKPTRDNNFGGMVAISTGSARDQTQDPFVSPVPQIDTTNDVVPLPSPYGSVSARAVGDNPCGKPSTVFDSLRISYTMRQPTNAEAFAYRVRFLNAEHSSYPPNVANDGSPLFCFPDTFVLLKNTSYATPADHNIATDKNAYSLNANNPYASFWTACDFYTNFLGNCLESDLDLEFLSYAAGSAWQAIGTAATHGEQYRLDFLLYSGSNVLNSDSTVLIDGYIPISEELGNFPLYGYKTTADLSLDHFFVAGNDKNGLLCPGSQTVTFEYKITNIGPEDANRVTVSFTPPFGTSYVSSTLLPCSIYKQAAAPFASNSFYKCRLSGESSGQLPALNSVTGTITFRVNPEAGQKIRIRLTATTASVDEDFSNNFKIATLFTRIDC